MQRIDVALIQRKIHEQGLWKVLRRIIAELGQLAYRRRSCYIFRDDLDRPPSWEPGPLLEPLSGFRFRWLDLSLEADRRIMADMMGRSEFDYPPEDLQRRLDHGDRTFVALDGDRVVAYHWLCFGEREIFSGERMKPPPGECFLYDGYTFQEYRGRRLIPWLLYYTRRDLAREGIARILIDVATTNTSSIRAVEVAGFQKHLRITRHILFSSLKFSCRRILPADRETTAPAGAGR